jgi:hypothetical protein
MLTSEERAAIALRMADLKAKMDALDHLRNHDNIPEWAKLYEERDALESLLGDSG